MLFSQKANQGCSSCSSLEETIGQDVIKQVG
jgi:hypothetical protein